jgi:hypothetical protein
VIFDGIGYDIDEDINLQCYCNMKLWSCKREMGERKNWKIGGWGGWGGIEMGCVLATK